MTNPNEPVSPDFVARVSQHLHSAYPSQTAGISGADLNERLNSSAARAARYGLETEDQILCFASATLLLGVDFDSDPHHAWGTEILLDAALSADERAAMVVAIAELLLEDSQNPEAQDGQSRF